MHAIPSQIALPKRKTMTSPGNGATRWRTEYFGIMGGGKVLPEPQAFLIEMTENDTILPHFHEVDQFQVFVSGSGKVGRSEVMVPLTVHYADRYTGYGPIDAGPQGYSYFTLRAHTDSGPVYLHKPGYREKLQPSQKRHFSAQVALSTEPVLKHRKDVSVEVVTEQTQKYDDGLQAELVRAGADIAFTGPDPKQSGGQYYLVVNGSITYKDEKFDKWSVFFAEPTDPAVNFSSGSDGCEVLILQFGKE